MGPKADGEPGDVLMTLWRKVALVAILAGLAVGLTVVLVQRGGGSDIADRAPASTVPSGTPVPPRPELRTTGEDFDAIVRSVDELSDWVYEYDPDPRYAALFDDPRCECYQTTEAALQSLKVSGQHHDSPGVRVHEVAVRRRASDHQVTLYVVIEGLPGSIVDRDGTVVQQRPTLPPTGLLEEWVRGPDGRWRTLDVTPLGPPEGGLR